MPAQAGTEYFEMEGVRLRADISVAPESTGLVLFVHGSGSSRHSPRNQFVAENLRSRGLGTVLMDLLSADEERADQFSGHLRFDIPFLARRVMRVVDVLRRRTVTQIGLFGASTGAAAALVVAAADREIAAVVSRGGRPDLAGEALSGVAAPTLLIVGELDTDVLQLNRQAMARMQSEVRLEVVPGASHLFHEPGALETVARLAGDWFLSHLEESNETTRNLS